MKIKCTYEDCFRHFSSREAMIAHKTKDPNHSYCALCDVDCGDDMLLFIHQLGTSAHICCPVCAQEFKSAGGRDRHVEQNHRTAQNIDCAGCHAKFASASALMYHIENDQCSVIKLEDFQMQRAEKQIHKEACVANGEIFSTGSSMQSIQRAPTISSINNGTNQVGGRPVRNSSRSLSNALGGPISPASHEQFPPLSRATIIPGQNQQQVAPDRSVLGAQSKDAASNLINFDNVEKSMAGLQVGPSAWDSQGQGGESQGGEGYVSGWLASVNTSTRPPPDNNSEVASMYDKKVAASAVSENIPPSVQGPDRNPFSVLNRIIQMPAHSIISSNAPLDIERFWDATLQQYTCPGERCRRHFANTDHFRKHLLTSAHVGGQVVCPSCLKRFATTFAWVAHCESPSKRCDIRNSANLNHVIREITGGVLATDGHLNDGTVQYVAPKIEEW
ncbi:hypothetical protein A1O1_02822 [Capronia coronata CBS 617.96]|uniref:C2H2-type domain-containing protein n=1 Tax=Capronia coronata CBS 617.96 TaxID=1182541 RepID=W9YNE9_9EURO|nr:uncharacterized protein A1O1_02822 [Capronia coronata CBS 617.96]EXJ94427.1 hypothetical protein A1O1_02822 [Capronia coronata CBS 617.96]